MNYENIYNELIESRKHLNRDKNTEYYERHHIIPRCMGGSDDPENLILLTGREHFIAHLILSIAHKDTEFYIKLRHAVASFVKHKNSTEEKFRARDYEKAKILMSETKKLLVGDKNPFYGKTHSEEIRKRISKRHLGVSYEEKFGKDKAEEIKQKISNRMKGRPAHNKGKPLNLSEQGIKNMVTRNKKFRKPYIITRPNGEEIEILGIKDFCDSENAIFGLSLNPSSVKNLLYKKNLKTDNYKGYKIRKL